ncbi:hypothetical protein [Halobaculum gomorrense]|uniref:Flagellar protein FlaF n=1 Tax=Halobaculum gomorrense TaxID=43928 RepID=A0A1M5Q846_9EURY|nr:hypothetical protein [Halobaculum gomorrense]SHH10367.1 flagellar protein FlaF [Halobaculum gomorrense]
MGFSVSASAGVVFLGVFLAIGIVYPAAANGFERVSDARHDAADRALAQANTGVTVTNATYNDSTDTLIVNATNDGTTAVDVSDAGLFADNNLTAPSVTVAGDGGTDVWLPGETAHFEVSLSTAPDRVQVVVDHGVRDASAVEVI